MAISPERYILKRACQHCGAQFPTVSTRPRRYCLDCRLYVQRQANGWTVPQFWLDLKREG